MFATKLLIFALLALVPQNKSQSSDEETIDTSECIGCICHALTSCREITQCALVSVDFEYWRTATAEELSSEQEIAARTTYNACINNETCVLNTISLYTEKFLDDINCDGAVNCADRFAVHLWGKQAKDPAKRFNLSQAKRFDRCIGHEQNVTEDNRVSFKPEPNCVILSDRLKDIN